MIMLNWYYLIGGFAYIIIGVIWLNITTSYLEKLTEKVMNVYNDWRYAKMLWYNVSMAKTEWKQHLIDILIIAIWPIVCIVATLKAEWNYDRIMRRNCFRKEVP